MYWMITRIVSDVSYLETIERILCKFNHFDRDNQIYLIGIYLQFCFLYIFFILHNMLMVPDLLQSYDRIFLLQMDFKNNLSYRRRMFKDKTLFEIRNTGIALFLHANHSHLSVWVCKFCFLYAQTNFHSLSTAVILSYNSSVTN